MLKMNEKITVSGVSVLEDGTQLEGYQATIDSSNPKNIQFTSWQVDKDAYKANRSVARADSAAFEDHVFSIQDEMIAELEVIEEETNPENVA